MICGPNAAFWGCVGREAVIMDEAIDFVHEACREHHVPCFRGGPFWEDLVPFRRVVNKKNGNIDQWHHADYSYCEGCASCRTLEGMGT